MNATDTAVFLGPSLPRAEAEAVLPAAYLPPARRGDVYRLLGTGVRRIVLIDGVFFQTQSVWPREILAALDDGIEVWGASSMGALRAAELHPFGMRGFGRIFEWYRDGVIDGDDEVALLHGPAETSFARMSEPLVNIRFHLMNGVERGILSEGEADELISYSRNRFFGDRSFGHLASAPLLGGLPPDRREAILSYLRDPADLKAGDARGLLASLAERGARSKDLWDGSVVGRVGREATTCAAIANRRSASGRAHGTGMKTAGGWQACGAGFHPASGAGFHPASRFSTGSPSFDDCAESGPAHRLNRVWQLEQFRAQTGLAHADCSVASLLRKAGVDPLRESEFRDAIVKRAYVLDWAAKRSIALPDPIEPADPEFLRRNRVSPPAWIRMSIDRKLHRHLLECDPRDFSLPADERPERALLVAWAEENGIDCPPHNVKSFIAHRERTTGQAFATLSAMEQQQVEQDALVEWIAEKTPGYFGIAGWDLRTAVVEELQFLGLAERLYE